MKKKNLMQESFSDLGEAFGTLTDERVKNLIPIPGGKQVRAHHSIPAAPRHNIGNLEKQRNHNVGYQMKKMAEGISLFNQVGNSSTMNNSLERIPKPESKQNTAHRKNNKQFSDFKPKNKLKQKPVGQNNGPSMRSSHNDALNSADYNTIALGQ